METIIFIGHIIAALTATFGLLALMAWLISLPEGRFKEPREFAVRIIQKVPTEETDFLYYMMSTPTICEFSASQWGWRRLQLIVNLNDRQIPCNCTPEFYKAVEIGDTITVIALVDLKKNETQKFCYAP